VCQWLCSSLRTFASSSRALECVSWTPATCQSSPTHALEDLVSVAATSSPGLLPSSSACVRKLRRLGQQPVSLPDMHALEDLSVSQWLHLSRLQTSCTAAGVRA
jgi:hypothetical protein